ncbi:1,4-beta-xylanase [Halovulum dunhuangense]|uniref:1,4-beta-xylanase n=1 Tax=Halovulum dunhuangense TaxID=1505036 RepID=A0A849L4V1_9RHOB|nr:1,4-beta-xylanase [Halovulum dunhuangense]NNU81468.1 1,4-beta-xylanase [Halovulum dunhuangense]
MERWSEEDAKAWWASTPWICGFNFLPSTAVNFLEMWHRDSFDRATIERELGWAAEIGYNACRVNLHFLVWKHDRDGLIGRLDWFLDTATRLGIRTVPCLFDDCGFGGAEPVYGPQPDPLPGVHNGRAVASPGRATVMDRNSWPALEAYARDIVRSFGHDRRVLFWDIYNEPGNRMQFSGGGFSLYTDALVPHSRDLMEASFAWVRAEAPIHPLTVGAWTTPLPGENVHPYQTEIDRSALLHSDIITFHAYWRAGQVAKFIDYLEVLDRPMLCTEWMARAVDSRISDQLRMFHDRGVGCFQWGLVRGRTQTDAPWPEALVRTHGGRADRGLWFHDVLHADGSPYDPAEIETIRGLMRPDRTVRQEGA